MDRRQPLPLGSLHCGGRYERTDRKAAVFWARWAFCREAPFYTRRRARREARNNRRCLLMAARAVSNFGRFKTASPASGKAKLFNTFVRRRFPRRKGKIRRGSGTAAPNLVEGSAEYMVTKKAGMAARFLGGVVRRQAAARFPRTAPTRSCARNSSIPFTAATSRVNRSSAAS